MHKVKIFTIGKAKEPWLQLALAEYEQRLKPILSVEWILAKNDPQLKQFLEKERNYLCLDPLGKQYTSEEFSSAIISFLEKGGSRLELVIGGAEGIPSEIRERAVHTFSLSRLTFTHQMTRLILLEQLYRAFEIAKGTGYHK